MRSFDAEIAVAADAAQAMQRLRTILDGLGGAGHSQVQGADTVAVQTRVNMASWGERVTCTVTPVEAGGVRIRVRSESLVKFTLIDFGVNRRNVERVIESIRAG